MATSLSVIFNAIDNMTSKLGTIASSGRAVESTFQSIENRANGSIRNIEAGSDAIGRSLDSASASAASLASSVGTYGSEAANAVSSADSLASSSGNAETALNETASAAQDAAKEFEEVGEQAEGAGNSSEEFGEKSASAMNDFNNLLISGGIVAALHEVADGLAECATNAEIVETAVAKLQTIAGESSIDSLQQDIMALSNETGQAAEELSDTAYNAISAGTAVEESVATASQANKLAVAGFTDTTSALSVLETALNSYGEAAGGMVHISDSLITTQNLGVTTVQQLAAQMGKAISTASAYNVSLENLESGYISVTKAGINTAEGTTYLSSMLNELGNSGSEISKLLKDETGNTFGELMNEGKSIADVLGMIYDACDNNAEAMMNMWGSAEAGKAANAIISQGLDTFNDNLTTLQESTGTTAEAYAVMADTTKYAHDKMNNAAQNTSVQIGEVLNPTLTKLYAGMEKIYTGIGNIVAEHPVVVKAIAAATIGVAAFAGGIATYTAATTIATAVQTAFNGAMLANPVFLLIGGVAALTTGMVFLAESYEEARDATDELTLASQEQKTEIERLEKEYDEACEKYGANSKEASELALEIRRLEDAYGEAGETIGEFHQRIEDLSTTLDEIYETYNNNIKSTDDLYGSSTMLIGELQALQSQTSMTDAELSLMKQIVTELNDSYSDLGLSINETTGKTNYSISDLYSYAQEQKEQQKIDTASQALVAALGKYEEVKSAYEQAGDEVGGERDKYEDMQKKWIGDHPILSQIGKGAEVNWSSDLGKQFDAWEKAQDNYQTASDNYDKLNSQIREYCEQLGYSTEETEEFIQQLENGANDAATKFGETGEEIVSYKDAVSGAVISSQEELTELAEAYEEAHDAALESIEGQYSLWDKVDKKVLSAKTSVDKIGSALDSQIQYWKDYSKNLDNLQGRDVKGLDDVLKNMDDGSEESAVALAGMAKASDKELEKIVNKYEKLQKVQGKTADKVADLESDFASKCEEMSNDLETSIKKMNMEQDAESAARKTIQAYINSIRSGVSGAKNAAEAVANAAANALKVPERKTPRTPTSSANNLPQLPNLYFPLPGHASGTTDSEQVYVAGEEGPELILSGGGDTVFPTSETDRIISAVSNKDDNRQITEPSAMSGFTALKVTESDAPAGGDRTMTIRLEGSGAISVGAGSSKEEIWNGTKGKIKSAFMQILREEVFEEGASAYEF